MNYFIFTLLAALLILDVNCKKDGYPVGGDQCRYNCWKNEYCDGICKQKKGEGGYCYGWNLSCWCTGLPDDTNTKMDPFCQGLDGK
uniref:NaTx n=1 Tax=Centruroides hentzi TaxID=88313 RepID=A0A2I9LPC6_9SCOR